MNYWGKILSMIFSFLSGSNIWIMILFLLIGHIVDKIYYTNIDDSDNFINGKNKENIFFCITFQVLGYLNKLKGRITEEDIHNANMLMVRFKLNNILKNIARKSFYEGKSKYFPLHIKLQEFHRACSDRLDLINMFLEIQIQASFFQGVLYSREKKVLYIIAEELNINKKQFDYFINIIKEDIKFKRNRENFYKKNYQQHDSENDFALKNAYKVLGVKQQDNMITIKRAYRKLMNIYHPDKLIAKGLSPKMMEVAKRKAQAIQQSYALIKKEKNFH